MAELIDSDFDQYLSSNNFTKNEIDDLIEQRYYTRKNAVKVRPYVDSQFALCRFKGFPNGVDQLTNEQRAAAKAK